MQYAVKCKNYVTSDQIWKGLNNRKVGISSDSASLKKNDSLDSGTEADGKRKPVDFSRDIIRVNVCGQEHYIQTSLIAKYPNTLLGSVGREKYFRQDLNSYYFDRNRHAFDAVMGYYLSGGVFMYPSKLNREVVHREMLFYKIPMFEEQEPNVIELPVPKNLKEKIYLVLNYPKSSTAALIMSIADCVLIFLAVGMLILETEPQFKEHFTNELDPWYKYLFGLNTAIMIYFTADYFLRLFTHPTYQQFFKLFLPWLDLLSILPFYVEVMMMMVSGNSSQSVHPTSRQLEVQDDESGNHGIVVLRLCRIFRVTRVFKFARRSENLLILLKAVGNTYKELILLSGVVSLAVVSFGSIMYTIESIPGEFASCKEVPVNNTFPQYNISDNSTLPDGMISSNVTIVCQKTQFSSILISCWWAVITVTTVGYGDMIPMSTLGKCMGSFAVFCGLIIIALPATIIVTRFSEEYERSKMQNEMSPMNPSSL